ncbi:MAG: hypothetical protein H5T69_07345 [Chloroflexi bacterium]|nr:hypothetical protein [Chloroflexota bacterium]
MSKKAGRRVRRNSAPLLLVSALMILVLGMAIYTRTRFAPPEETQIRIERIDVQEARALIDQGRAILVDVRGQEYYAQKHALGALWFDEADVAGSLSQLPSDKLLIFY